MTLGIRNGHVGWRSIVLVTVVGAVVAGVNPAPAAAQGATEWVPRGLTIDGVGCLAPASGRVTGAEPLVAGLPLTAGSTVRARVEVRTPDGSSNLRSWQSTPIDAGEVATWQVTPALPDGAYRWRMQSEVAAGGVASSWTSWCGFTVDTSEDSEPAPEPSADVECPVTDPGDEPVPAADESAALLVAQACDTVAEAMSERDFGSRVLARPDGVLVAEQFTEPQWAHDGAGEWTEVDTTFAVAGDGSVSTVAAVSRVEVSPGGTGPLVTMTDPDGGSMSVTWPDALPAPVVAGDTVTYPEVFDDVDLRVSAGVDGFSYVLVVKSAAAAASPELASVAVGIDTAGGLVVDQDAEGTVVVEDAAGEMVFSAPAAYMWDSSEPEEPAGGSPSLALDDEGSGLPGDGGPGRFTEMPLDLDGGTLVIEPDQNLLSDPEVEFPVMIDPPFSGKRMHWANVHQQQPNRGWTDDSAWPREKEMRIGRLGNWPGYPCGDACGLWRSAIRFDVGALAGRQIISAEVKAVQTHTSGCGSYPLQLWYVTAFTSGVTWNQMNSRWENQLGTQTISSSNRTGGCSGTSATGVTFGGSAVRNRVQSHADAGHGSLSFGFRSSDESSINPYRRIAIGSVKLEVEYNRPAQVPTNLNTDGRGCATSSPGPWLTTQRPTLSGKPRDPDGRVGAHLQIRRIGSSATRYAWRTSPNRSHNRVVNHRLPSGDKLASGSYRWQMRSLDSHPQGTNSAWRGWCYFRVDVTSPTTPTVEVVGGPPEAGQPVTLRFRSSDAHSGLAGFDYGVNEEVRRSSVNSSGTATVTFTAPAAGGRSWIYVWSRDEAGNTSRRAVFDFFAARYVEATPAAAWRLDGDGLDDSGNGHELHLGSGVEWSDEAAVPGSSSLDFDATGCVATDGPVVRTDAEYTVTAWVRLDADDGPYAVMAPAGQTNPGFSLRYHYEEDRWVFVLGDRDTSGVVYASLRSAGPPVLGEWTHLAVRVDPATQHMQMYVDGQLSSEREIPWAATWNASGPVYVGCSGPASGQTWGHFAGAIQHVGVWQGLLTPAQIEAIHQGELPAGTTGDWALRANGTDGSPYGRDLTVPSGSWVDDQYGRQRSALRLDGTAWAEAGGPVVRTDQSFTVAAWARLDAKNDFHTVLSQGGEEVTTFNLSYHPTFDRWQLSMSSVDDANQVTWRQAQSTITPVVGQWYHLVGVFDRHAGQLRLYVDGQWQSSATGPAEPWQGDGPLLVGTGGNLAGERSNRMVGTISDVQTWRGALTEAQVAEVHGGNPAVRQLSLWHLDGDGQDLVGGNPLTVSGSEGSDYDWVEDQFCFPFSALGLHLAGQGHARTAGPVVTTDASFTVAAWVKLDDLTGTQTVVSQGGTARAGMQLQVTSDGRWRFTMPQQDSGSAALAVAESPSGVAEVDAWTHLAGVFDLAQGELRLYVNGEEVAVGAGVTAPWSATGPFYIGAAGTAGGATSAYLNGAVDHVATWESTLDPDRISDLGTNAMPVPCF